MARIHSGGPRAGYGVGRVGRQERRGRLLLPQQRRRTAKSLPRPGGLAGVACVARQGPLGACMVGLSPC